MSLEENTSKQNNHKINIKKRYDALVTRWGHLPSGKNDFARLAPTLLILIALPLIVLLSFQQQNLKQKAASIACNDGLVCGACTPNTNSCNYGNGTESCSYTKSLDGSNCTSVAFPNVICYKPNCQTGSACSTSQQCIASGLTPTPTPFASGPIFVNKNNVTIDGATITGSVNGSGYGIEAEGTAANPITNLIIRNCHITGFNVGILLYYVSNITIENCDITDQAYAGILALSAIGGKISGNTIDRIGNNLSPSVIADNNNAYGIALTRTATSSFITDPRSANIVVDKNTVTNVPLWHCMDTHAGQNITFSNNITGGCPRAYFITGDSLGNHPLNITLTANTLKPGISVSGGTNLAAVTLVNVQTFTGTNNIVSQSYGTPYFYDYLGDPAGSTNVSVTGTTTIP